MYTHWVFQEIPYFAPVELLFRTPCQLLCLASRASSQLLLDSLELSADLC